MEKKSRVRNKRKSSSQGKNKSTTCWSILCKSCKGTEDEGAYRQPGDSDRTFSYHRNDRHPPMMTTGGQKATFNRHRTIEKFEEAGSSTTSDNNINKCAGDVLFMNPLETTKLNNDQANQRTSDQMDEDNVTEEIVARDHQPSVDKKKAEKMVKLILTKYLEHKLSSKFAPSHNSSDQIEKKEIPRSDKETETDRVTEKVILNQPQQQETQQGLELEDFKSPSKITICPIKSKSEPTNTVIKPNMTRILNDQIITDESDSDDYEDYDNNFEDSQIWLEGGYGESLNNHCKYCSKSCSNKKRKLELVFDKSFDELMEIERDKRSSSTVSLQYKIDCAGKSIVTGTITTQSDNLLGKESVKGDSSKVKMKSKFTSQELYLERCRSGEISENPEENLLKWKLIISHHDGMNK